MFISLYSSLQHPPSPPPVNLQDIHLQKPFKSLVRREQQVLSRTTVPRAILEVQSKDNGLLLKFADDSTLQQAFHSSSNLVFFKKPI